MENNKKIRVCHVISDYSVGGAGILLCNLLSAIDRERFPSVAFVPRSSELITRLSDVGAQVVVGDFPAERSFSLSGYRELVSFLSHHPCDIVHTHGAAFGRMAAKRVGALAVNTRHCDTKMKTYLYNLVTDFTVATSENMMRSMYKIPAEKRLFIPNGSSCQALLDANKRLQIKQSLGIPFASVVVGFAGRLEKIKGCDVFLRGAALALSMCDSLYFVIVGDGSEREALHELAVSLGIEKRVIFCGYSDRVWEYMNIFDIGVNSSLGSETSSLAISEMMSMGIAVVASDIAGNSYMLKNSSGVLFPVGDPFLLGMALFELARDEKKRALYGAAAKRRYLGEFSLSRMVERYERLYTRLVGT